MASTTCLQEILAAFKAVLEAAGLGVEVYEETPYEGAEQRSVVLTPTAGHTETPCLGLRITSTTRAMEEHCTLQISCFHDEQEACRSLADKVNQALFDHAGDLERVYDIHNLRRTLGPILGPVDIGVRESHILMAFQFYTHRAVT